jgi:membrane protease subunit HflK
MSDGNFDFHFKPPQIKLKPKVIATFAVVIIAVIVTATTFYMVDQTEKAVILRFGKFMRITGPGLHVRLPFGIEKNYNVQTEVIQLMSFDFKSGGTARPRGSGSVESTMLT